MKKNVLCRIGIHNEKPVRELRVREKGLIKVYEVVKCERCGRLNMNLRDVIVEYITPQTRWNDRNEKEYNLKTALK